MLIIRVAQVVKMRKVLIVSVFLAVLSVTVGFVFIQQPVLCAQTKTSLREYILTADNKPTAALTGLLHTLELSHDESLVSIVAITQKAWLRKPGQERWDLEDEFNERRKEFIPYFKALGLIDTISPKKKSYCSLVLLGATLSSVRNRFNFAIELWNQGVRFETIVALGSQRPLNAETESVATLFDYHNKILPIRADWEPLGTIPQVEIDMMKMVIDQAIMPEAMRTLPITVIDAPMKKNAQGELVRATTPDTVELWLASKPKPGNCLVVSNQAYVGYQDAVMRTVLPHEFVVETVGKSFDEDTLNCAVVLDSLARWLYQELVAIKN